MAVTLAAFCYFIKHSCMSPIKIFKFSNKDFLFALKLLSSWIFWLESGPRLMNIQQIVGDWLISPIQPGAMQWFRGSAKTATLCSGFSWSKDKSGWAVLDTMNTKKWQIFRICLAIESLMSILWLFKQDKKSKAIFWLYEPAQVAHNDDANMLSNYNVYRVKHVNIC